MDNYTPHGYLDNPWHSARLNPSGVIRCRPAIGFAWHFPAFAGLYVRRQLYTAGLRLAVRRGEALLLSSDDFAGAGIALVSRLHSKDIMSFDWQQGQLSCHAAYLLCGEHALCCLLSFENFGGEPADAGWAFVAEYERAIAEGDAWDCGLLARRHEDSRAVALAAYPEGEAFVCAVNESPAVRSVSASLGGLLAGLAETNCDGDPGVFDRAMGGVSQDGAAAHTGPPRGWSAVAAALAGRATLRPGEHMEMLAVLGRGATEPKALAAARAALASQDRPAFPRARTVHDAAVARDAAFRQSTPQLSGDWPAHWRRGLVYDVETLRMVARPPLGVYRRPWDGMQIQSPRVVVAEAALDALILSYADPDLARQVLLGAFADGTAPNAPCSREDGGHNMVAEDGAACGTAPEWCFPVFCADLLHRRCGDRRWLTQMYLYLARYLDWWLRWRTDHEGWLYYHCSWESGQDDSPRFGPQRSGGTLIRHIRPPDLQAAMAQGAAILARFAGELGRPRAALRWQRVAAAYAAKTQALWQEGWFRDFDTAAGRPVSFCDVMHLAPVMAGLATPEQLAVLRPAFTNLPPHGIWPALEWPPVVFTTVEAAAAAGWHDMAGALAAGVADRVYRTSDSRSPSADDPLPGIAREHWPIAGHGGCEGYGWGALPTLLAIRHVVGWQEGVDGTISLHPALPADWVAPGKQFAIGPLHHRGGDFFLKYRCSLAGGLDVILESAGSPRAQQVRHEHGEVLAVAAGRRVLWPARNGGSYRIELEQ